MKNWIDNCWKIISNFAMILLREILDSKNCSNGKKTYASFSESFIPFYDWQFRVTDVTQTVKSAVRAILLGKLTDRCASLMLLSSFRSKSSTRLDAYYYYPSKVILNIQKNILKILILKKKINLL